MLLISSTVVIVLFFIFPLFRAFRPAEGIVFMCGFHGEDKDGRQGICGEILWNTAICDCGKFPSNFILIGKAVLDRLSVRRTFAA
jgi:hypothetical protein